MLLASTQGYSQEKTRISALDNSQWTYNGNKTMCSISHEIETFGIAEIIAEAGEETRLEIKSNELKKQVAYRSIYEISPVWATGSEKPIYDIGMIDFSPITGELVIHQAGSVFDKLKNGTWIKVLLKDERQITDGVVLSNINFLQPAEEFLKCRNNLLPVNYQQVRNSEFYFVSGSTSVSRESLRALRGISEYIKETASISKVLIDGHSDNRGRTGVKLRMSRERAEEVAAALIEFGIPHKMIQIRSHGDRYPIADNAQELGRKKNRRVTVRLIKKSAAG
ncbi:OmpA family protein [uncultured Photobacterium sp.]|uniref:OmpA family protein n=1 Tax=uncultured Photobacterium sp. TaxID=173973 RepID=UPI00260E052C|nr:OmpA family protein [uncultured Photobacterium sp.]